MTTSTAFFIALGLMLATPACDVSSGGGGGTDATITCSHFDSFLYDCTASCSPTWNCESNYASMSRTDQLTLDTCSDCLVGNLDAGLCGDCSVPNYGVSSCHAFMSSLLGVSCW